MHEEDYGDNPTAVPLLAGRSQVADTAKEPNLLKHRDVKNSILEGAGLRAEPGAVPTFPQFIDYVLAETKGLKGPRDWKVSLENRAELKSVLRIRIHMFWASRIRIH
jgi:hypothetical protein